MATVKIMNSEIDEQFRHEPTNCRFRDGWLCLHSDYREKKVRCVENFCISRFCYEDRKILEMNRAI